MAHLQYHDPYAYYHDANGYLHARAPRVPGFPPLPDLYWAPSYPGHVGHWARMPVQPQFFVQPEVYQPPVEQQQLLPRQGMELQPAPSARVQVHIDVGESLSARTPRTVLTLLNEMLKT